MFERDASNRRISPAEATVIVAFVAFCGLLGAGVYLLARSDGAAPVPTRTIYSSMPYRAAGGAPNERSADNERAMTLALEEAEKGKKTGRYKIVYEPLNASDADGPSDAKTVVNAHIARRDPRTAVYIGDFTSTATMKSIPVLSRYGVAQISANSTRVGLTLKDPTADFDEPYIHYKGDRNFARVIPNDNVQAAAIVALMQRDGCKRVAIVYEGDDYSDGLTNNQRAFARPKRLFRQRVRLRADPQSYRRLAREAKKRGADCFQYAGRSDEDTTLAIFQTFASELPDTARLYASDAVRESTFTSPAARRSDCVDVKLMVPPRDLVKHRDFLARFMNRFRADYRDGKLPDPAAVYAYEAMALAIATIARTPNGTRDEIREELLRTEDRSSELGTYSIDKNGDTTLVDYDVSEIHGCKAGPPKRAIGRELLKRRLQDLENSLDR